MKSIFFKRISSTVAVVVFTLLVACNNEQKQTGNTEETVAGESTIADTQQPVSEYVEDEAYDFSQEVPSSFKEQLDNVVTPYLGLKNALVEGNASQAEVYSSQMLAALDKVEMQGLSATALTFWQEKADFLKSHLKLSQQAKDIEAKRANFVFLSQAMVKTADAFDPSTEPLYIQYCPMANNNKGAFWISQTKEIKNPYFGEKMLTCGETKEEI